MLPSFAAIQPYYENLLARMKIPDHELPFLDQVAGRIIAHKDRYLAVQAATTCYWPVVGVIHEREASGNFRCNLAQGDSLNRPSVHVPRGRPPLQPGMSYPVSWEYAAEDAIQIDHLDKVASWSMPRACYELEIFNGMGYWARRRPSPYLWAGSSNYVSGKFVSDGNFDPNAVDRQLGTIPLLTRMMALDSTIKFSDAPPVVPVLSRPAPAPEEHLHNVLWLQQSLNVLGADPALRLDGSFGKKTRREVEDFQQEHDLQVDGVVGPKTEAAIVKALVEVMK